MKGWLGTFLLFCSLILPLRAEKYALLVGIMIHELAETETVASRYSWQCEAVV